MIRYCISCHKVFGCIKQGKKLDCDDCAENDRCISKSNVSLSHATGGVCKNCWENREMRKVSRNASY